MNRHHAKNEKGFTLIELLIALALAGILSTAIYSTFISQEKVYKTQQLVAEMQQNARAAMLIAAKEARMINAYLGSDGLRWWDELADAGQESKFIRGFRAHNNSSGGTDALDIVYADFTVSTPLRESMPQPSAELKVVSVEGFMDGMFAIISDGEDSDLMEITQVQGAAAQKLQHNPAADSGLNSPNGLNKAYGEGAMVFQAKLVSFRILHDDPDHPKLGISLNYNPNADIADREYFQLVEDIEDFQIAYIFEDGDVANEPDEGLDADTSNDYEDVAAIRLTVVARTRQPVNGYPGTAPLDIEDHDTSDAPDHFHRRVLTEEILVRNFHL